LSEFNLSKAIEECKSFGEFKKDHVKIWLDKYICDYKDLQLYHNLDFDMTTKEGIKECIDIIGKLNTWNLLKKQGSKIIDLILDS